MLFLFSIRAYPMFWLNDLISSEEISLLVLRFISSIPLAYSEFKIPAISFISF